MISEKDLSNVAAAMGADLQRAKDGEKFTGQTAPPLDAGKLRFGHLMAYEEEKRIKNDLQQMNIRRTTTAKALVSDVPLRQLSETTYCKLLLNVPAKGSYLLLRTLEPPRMTIGLQTVVEDREGSVCTLALYNYISPKSGISQEAALPVGTTLIYKEPYLKTGAAGGFILRCDSPTDIVVIGRDSPLHAVVHKMAWRYQPSGRPVLECFGGKSPEDWKKRGNELFGQRAYNEAREAYAVALSMIDGSSSSGAELVLILNLNLAATFLSMECFEATIRHVTYVLTKDSRNKKALLRAGRAHYQLRQYKLAKDYFERLVAIAENDSEAKKDVVKCTDRLEEARNGVNMHRLFLSAKLKPATVLDVADFQGPWEVAQVPGKGRGAIATDDISAGTLLLVCKAFHAAFDGASQNSISHMMAMQMRTDIKTCDHGDNIELVAEITQSVMRNPEVFGTVVYDLTCGDSSLDRSKRYCDESTKDEPIANVERLRGIVSVNAFGLTGVAPGYMQTSSGSGLFLLASYINHSCLANASWSIYNDVMVIHAVKHIGRGEEITIAYHDCTATTYTERKKHFDHWKFTCDCRLCRLDLSESGSVRESRERLVAEERQLMEGFRDNPAVLPTTAVVRSHELLIEKLRKSYGQREQLRVALLLPYLTQAGLALRRFGLLKAVDHMSNAFACLGVDLRKLLICAEIGDNVDDIFNNDAQVTRYFMLGMLDMVAHCHDDGSGDTVWNARRLVAGLELLQRVTCGATRPMVKAQFPTIPQSLFS